jgi:WD40 repeat protein
MLLLAALLWWAATAASQEISLALRYRAGEAALAQGNLPIARQEFEAVRAGRAGYAEAELRLQEIAYRLGSDALARSDWPTAQRELAAAGSYSDASALLRESYYRPAITALSEEQWDTAAALIASLEAYDPNYRDLAERIAAAPDLRGPLALARWSSGRVGPALSFENQNLRLLDGGPPYLIFAERAAITQVDLLTGETLDLPSPDYRDTDRYAVAFSPEKEWVAYYTDDSAVSVARSDGSVVHDLADTDGSQWLNFSPDGKVIATSTDNAVFFWRLADGQLLAEIPAWSSNGFLPVRFSPDSKTAAVMRGNDLLLVQPEDGSVVNRIEMEDLRTFDFNPDGTLIVAASYNTLTFVSVEERGEPRQEQIDTGEFNLGAVEELRFSPDGSRIALISTSGVLVRPLSGSENTIFIASGTSAAFSPDSQILAVGTEANKTGELILYDLRDSRLLQQIGMQAEEWYSSYNYRFDELTFNDDGSVLISQSRATGITVWRSLPQA